MSGTGTIIRLFTVPGCGKCRALKASIEARGWTCQEVNVAGSFGALREMVRLSGAREVPVAVVGDAVVVGPDVAALDRLLEKRT
ncbi:MAG: hypothetical protein KKB20_27990 [Proteobacteria bacterium]|nr:hypothetical protein [Pseudomonadota bacterium]